jgi:hypothetical protein
MKTYMSRANARKAAMQEGINEPDISVYHITTPARAKAFGLDEKAIGRYVWLDAQVQVPPVVKQPTAPVSKWDRDEVDPDEAAIVALGGTPSAELNDVFEEHREIIAIKGRFEDLPAGEYNIVGSTIEVAEDGTITQTGTVVETGTPVTIVIPAVNTLKANLNQSTVAKPVRRVHEIADSMPGARRKDVVAACVAEGIAMHTARTQYQVWFRNQRRIAATPPAELNHDV